MSGQDDRGKAEPDRPEPRPAGRRNPSVTPIFSNERERAAEVQRRLIGAYGERERVPRREPMHELISTMLSHRTTEADETRAYARMRERFPTWDRVRHADLDALIETISPAR